MSGVNCVLRSGPNGAYLRCTTDLRCSFNSVCNEVGGFAHLGRGITDTTAFYFSVKLYDITSGLYYDHFEQVQLYASELKIATYVDKTGSSLYCRFEFITQTNA